MRGGSRYIFVVLYFTNQFYLFTLEVPTRHQVTLLSLLYLNNWSPILIIVRQVWFPTRLNRLQYHRIRLQLHIRHVTNAHSPIAASNAHGDRWTIIISFTASIRMGQNHETRGHNKPIRKSKWTSPPRDNRVSEPVLQSSVLVEDSLPVWLDSPNAAGDDFVKDGDDGLLGKVFALVCIRGSWLVFPGPQIRDLYYEGGGEGGMGYALVPA